MGTQVLEERKDRSAIFIPLIVIFEMVFLHNVHLVIIYNLAIAILTFSLCYFLGEKHRSIQYITLVFLIMGILFIGQYIRAKDFSNEGILQIFNGITYTMIKWGTGFFVISQCLKAFSSR